MILDTLEHLSQYEPLLGRSGLLRLVEELRDKPAGRYELENGAYASLQEGVTTPAEEKDLEAHRKYLDLQVVLEGAEGLVWRCTDGMAPSVPYDGAGDIVLYQGEGLCQLVRAGMFYVLFPWDGHKACCTVAEPTRYRKLVVKLPADGSLSPENA